MVDDELAKKTNTEKIIEVFIKEGEVGVWIPAMATSLWIINKDQEPVRVRGLRVRNLKSDLKKEE